MIARLEDFDFDDENYAVDYRQVEMPTCKRIVIGHKNQVAGRQKLANRARYRRGGEGSKFNGAHRRRDKRV